MRIQEFVYVLLVKSGILGFGIWDTAPINDWNPESKIHKVESRIQECLVFPPIGGLLAYFSVVIFLGKLLMPNDGNSQPDWYPPLPTDVRGDWLGWYIQIEQDEKCPPPPPTRFTPWILLEVSTLRWDSNSVYIWAWRCGLGLWSLNG